MMKNIIAYTSLIFKAIAAAFFVFIVFVFVLDSFQKRERYKTEKEEQLKAAKEHIIGSWSKVSKNVDDNKLYCLNKVWFDKDQNCKFSFDGNSVIGTYSLDLDSIYVNIKPKGSKKIKRFSYKYLLIKDWGVDHMVLINSTNYTVKYKRVEE